MHARWRRPPGGGPHAGAEPPRLVEGGAEGALVFGVLLHGVGVVVVRGGRGVDWWPAVLWRRPRVRVTHVRRHLGHEVARRRSDGRRRCRHGWGWRRRVVDHVRGPAPLARVLHGVADGGRRWRRAEVLLRRRRCRRRHHVVRVRHHGRLARVVARVVVWRLAARVGGIPGG